MFKIEVFISGTNYSQYVSYPLTLTEKNFDDSLNLYELTLAHTPIVDPFKPNRQVVLIIKEDDITKRTLNLLLVNDSIDKLGRTNKYNHKLTFIEYTQTLEQQVLPDMTITRVAGVYEPTIKDVVEKILIVGNTNITLATNTAALLSDTESPEWTFTRYTVLEALRLVFAYVKLTPTMNTFTTLTHTGISAACVNPTLIEAHGKLEGAYDPQTFKTGIYSTVSNMVPKEAYKTIIEPENAWISPRSQSGNLISQDEAMIPTTRPIYQLNRADMRLELSYLRKDGTNDDYTIKIDLETLPQEWFHSFTEFIYEEGLYNIKENNTDVIYDEESDQFLPNQGIALYYIQGSANIFGLGGVAPSKWTIFPNRQALSEIIAWLRGRPNNIPYPTEYPDMFGAQWVKKEYLETFVNYMDNLLEQANPGVLWASFRTIRFIPKSSDINQIPKHVDTQFRIEYTPYINTNILSYADEKNNGDGAEIESQQFYNPSTTVISSEALAELHSRILKRGRGNTTILTFLNKSIDNVCALGTLVGDLILTSAQHILHSNQIISDYNFSEYYAKLNKFVSVLEQYRQFSIPSENIVERQFTRNIFANFELASRESVFDLDVMDYLLDEPARAFELMPENDPTRRIILPAVFYPFNNQIRYEVEFFSNANVGNQSDATETTGVRKNKPITYTDENGFMTELAIKLIDDYPGVLPFNWQLSDSHQLPKVNFSQFRIFFNENATILKDPRERLRYVFAIHHVDNTQNGRVTKYWPEAVGLTREEGGLASEEIYLAFIDIPYNTLDKVDTANVIQLYNTQNQATFAVNSEKAILLPRATYTAFRECKSWAIINKNYEVLYWYDEPVAQGSKNTQIYINFRAVWGEEVPTIPILNAAFVEKTIPYYTVAIGSLRLAAPILAEKTIPYYSELISYDRLANPILTPTIPYYTNQIDYTRLDNPVVDKTIPYYTDPIDLARLDNPLVDKSIPYYETEISYARLDNAVVQKTIPYYETAISYDRLDNAVVNQTIPYYSTPIGLERLDTPIETTTIPYYTQSISYARLTLPTVQKTVPYYKPAIIYQKLSTPLFVKTIPYYTTPISLFTVSFRNFDNTVLKTELVATGGSATAPQVPARTGYTFTNWSNAFTNVQSNIITTAQFTPIVYTITYFLNGGVNNPSNPSTYTIEDTPIFLLNPTRSGFVFAGWSPSNEIPANGTGNRTFTANWTAAITATFNSDGGTPTYNSQSGTSPLTVTNPGSPTRANFTFGGWMIGTTVISFPIGITSNTTFTAKWNPITVTATYDSQGGSFISPTSGTAPYSVPNPGNPNRSGFIFLGWTVNGNFVSFPFVISTNTTFVAQWEAQPTITVSFDSNGGSPTYASQSGQGSVTVTNPGSPTRAGFTFIAWTLFGFQVSFPFTTTTSRTLVADWESVPQATATFDSNGGSPNYSSQTGNTPFSVQNPGTPTRSGFTFNGWTVGGNIINFPFTINSNTIFTASWTQVVANPPATPSSASISSPADNQLFMSVSAVSGATSYSYRYRRIGTSAFTTVSSSNTSITRTSIDGQKEYEGEVAACNANGCSAYRYAGITFVGGFELS